MQFSLAVGTIGLLQALEAVKIVLGMPGVLAGRLLLFDGTETLFRNVKLRSRNPACSICGDNPSIDKLIDYEEFCGAKANDKNPNLKLLKETERISVQEYCKLVNDKRDSCILVDVRSPEEFEICRLPDSVNVPFARVSKPDGLALIEKEIKNVQNGDVLIDGNNYLHM